MAEFKHDPVLLNETIDNVITRSDGNYIDTTLGSGGHSRNLLEKLDPAAKLLAFDADQDAIECAKNTLANFKNDIKFINANYSRLKFFCQLYQVYGEISGIIFDLGVSSYQIDTAEKGFSFMHKGELDMRMDKNLKLTAYDIVNNYDFKQLTKIFYDYGEEKFSKKIAKKIIEERTENPIQTTNELRNVILKVIKGDFAIKSVARIFQAIRIEVNNELENLEIALKDAFDALHSGGRMAVISYHSLEDRITKNFMNSCIKKQCSCPPNLPICQCGAIVTGKKVGKYPIIPNKEEIASNPRARSAKLRIIEKL